MKTNETTTNQSNDLRHTININNSEANAVIKIRLNDECKNGHQDFSITATFWEVGKIRNDGNMMYGGCCHEEILKVRPDLKIFVNLHLCDYLGNPMYVVENGFYHLCEGFNNIKPNAPKFKAEYCEYYRITPNQFDLLIKSENQLRFGIQLEKLGILDQWRAEAKKAILLMEEFTGAKFLIDSTKSQYKAPTAEQVAEEDARDKEGYYKPENVQARKLKAIEDAKAKLYAEIEDETNKEIAKEKKAFEVKKAVLDGGLTLDNFIFYNHTNEGCFNWKNYGNRVTDEEFENFVKNVNIEGITWKNKG